MTETYRCWAEVDLQALRENLEQIRTSAGAGRKVLTVVKADAYGHGLRQIAAVLMQSGTDIFGVANLAEARAIRSVGAGWPILMLSACLPHEKSLAVREGIMPTISSLDEARAFSREALAQGTTVHLHLKVDTGMGRLGFSPENLETALPFIRALPGVAVSGLYTHYSSAEDDAVFTQTQQEIFAQTVSRCCHSNTPIPYIHAANSAGLLLDSSAIENTVRAGLLVYGIVPPGSRPLETDVYHRFRPALSWKCRVTFVKDVPPGTPVSYGHTYTTPTAMRLATISAGYGDGYLRAASNRASVLIGGERCRVLGRVTMDQMIVNASTVGDARPGDEVTLIGTQGSQTITATELACWCDTIPWEILTNITYRVPRTYRGGHAA